MFEVSWSRRSRLVGLKQFNIKKTKWKRMWATQPGHSKLWVEVGELCYSCIGGSEVIMHHNFLGLGPPHETLASLLVLLLLVLILNHLNHTILLFLFGRGNRPPPRTTNHARDFLIGATWMSGPRRRRLTWTAPTYSTPQKNKRRRCFQSTIAYIRMPYCSS